MSAVASHAIPSMRLLIVEDSEDEALLLARELRRAASEVTWKRVDSADTMRAALIEGDWDLVISDHAMPGFSSEDAFELVQRCGRDVPFIVYSGHFDETAAAAAMAKGVHDCVEKGNWLRLLPVVRRELRAVAQVRARTRAENRLHRLARYDELTGLPNRKLFYEQARRCLADVDRAGGATLLVLNVDRFMRINNTFGYALGDQLVRQVGSRLQHAVSGKSIVTRMGRDEFAILAVEAQGPEQARALVERVMDTFLHPFHVEGKELFLTLSIGICRFPHDGEDVGRLLVNAESAMFLAKRSGRNNYQTYVRDMNASSAERLQLETELRHAVGRGELVLHYQPSFDIASGRMTGVEALVRWRHPVHGLILPERFIPLADETGLIEEIGRRVLFDACAQAKHWRDAGLGPLRVSVNVSAMQFRQGDLEHVVQAALAQSGLPPQCLDLEITESVLMHDADATISILRALKNMGVCISADDFGTGYSSLAYLQRFPIDTLKIDKSFTHRVTVDEHNAAIVRTVIALAKSLRLESIAEGVESPEQVAYLRALGCDRLQGYYLCEPLPAENLCEFIRRAPCLP